MLREGTKIRLTTDNESYEGYFDRDLIITEVYSNDKEHRGYDMSVHPMKLVECITEEGENVPFAFYEWEFEEV